jgi:ABC-type transport system substrate-binding protein
MGSVKKIVSVVIVVAVIAVAGYGIYRFVNSNNTSVYNSSPKNSSELIDVAQVNLPDALDPATGFEDQDEPVFTSVFQELVDFNGTNYTQIVPVLASHWTEKNDQNYTFYLRPYLEFSNGQPVNASDVWFSFYRTIVMGQGPGVTNYEGILFNTTEYSNTCIPVPFGVRHAMISAGVDITGNYTQQINETATYLAKMLSDFNFNATEKKIMAYPDQAVVVINSTMVEINSIQPYMYLLDSIAGESWGAVVDPSAIDKDGGVQVNSQNSQINSNSTIGTGPYMIEHIGATFSTIVLVRNPNYWANTEWNTAGHDGIPAVAQPAHIKTIVIDYSLDHTGRVSEFVGNGAQISYVSPGSIASISSAFAKSVPYSSYFRSFANQPGMNYLSMNNGRYPLNITALRESIVHAINYSQLLQLYDVNGKALASEFLGPISPGFGNYSDPIGVSNYSYNMTLSLNLMKVAAKEGDFSVTLPNGTKIGVGKQLSSIPLYTESPVTTLNEAELTMIVGYLDNIGLKTSIKEVSAAVTDTWTNSSNTPRLLFWNWVPDFPDPVYQELMPLTNIVGGGYGGDMAYVNNTTLQKYYVNDSLPFINNKTKQLELVKSAYQIIYNLAPYAWLPYPEQYYFFQPYVHGVQYNSFTGYIYNMMYYSPT